MAIQCPFCGAQYDATLFQFDNWVLCDCGQVMTGKGPHRAYLSPGETPARRSMEELRRAADRISFLIVASDYQRIDIQIEIGTLRERCREFFPDRMELFEMIYGARFRRLWRQFREF